MKALHPTQKKLLDMAQEDMLSGLSLREIGGILEINHPQKVKYHLNELEKKGYIKISDQGSIEYLRSDKKDIIYLPVYGTAQCGPDALLAEENIEQMLPVAPQLFGLSDQKNYFLVRAKGNSMYPKITPGDLVLIESQKEARNDQVILASVDEKLQIKQYMRIDDHTVALKSFNEEYATQIFNEYDEPVYILGIVKNIIAQI